MVTVYVENHKPRHNNHKQKKEEGHNYGEQWGKGLFK